MRKPQALRLGDTVGLLAPSGSLRHADQATAAADMLRHLGFTPRLGESCRASHGYLAGEDALRAADIHAFFADPEVRGIVCLKGGYGAPRILDLLDYGMIAGNPKVFVGFSDITALLLALDRQCSLVTFHGPMGVTEALLQGDAFTTRSWLRALTSPLPLGRLENPPDSAPMTGLVAGRAQGRVVGGNLSLIAATLGTPFAIQPRGRILFIEDIDEKPYRIDRMLTQLRLAGVFEACAGILLGDWNHCVPDEGERSLELREIFDDILAPAGKPVLMGFQAGHCRPMITVPFGAEAALDADAGTFEILEAALLERNA